MTAHQQPTGGGAASDAPVESAGQRPDSSRSIRQEIVNGVPLHDAGRPHRLQPLEIRYRRLSRLTRRPAAGQRRRAALLALLPVLLVGAGVAGVLRIATPPEASAAQILLNHALASLRAAPADQATHATYALSTTGSAAVAATPLQGTLDVWVQRDTDGAIRRSALTMSSPVNSLSSRTIVTGDAATTYDAASNTILTGTVDHASLPNPLDTTVLEQLVRSAQAGTNQSARVLPQQSLDGIAVAVAEVSSQQAPNARQAHQITTLYVDAHTYLVRRMDVQTVDASGAVVTDVMLQLNHYDVIPLASTPSGTFTLNAPANARAVAAPDGSAQMGTQHITVAQAVAMGDRPALVLSGTVDGLQLQDVTYTRTPNDTIVSYLYTRGMAMAFGVNIFTWPSGTVQTSDPMFAPPQLPTLQPMSLTVAGQTVQATYADAGTTSHIAFYINNGIGVSLRGGGMSKEDFVHAVSALIDGRGQTAWVTRLQAEINAARLHPLR